MLEKLCEPTNPRSGAADGMMVAVQIERWLSRRGNVTMRGAASGRGEVLGLRNVTD